MARNVADGHIPGPQSRADVGKAWCGKGNHHPGGVTLTLAFPDAVAIAEAVYFGRTAFEWQENWKDYEVFVDGGETAVAGGTLQAGHGPQRIALPEGLRAKSLTLKFLTSYGGSNPGASEIQLFSQRLPDAAFASFSPPFAVVREEQWPASPVPEDAGMDRQLRSGGVGFSQVVVVERHAIEPTHVYTYHTEGQRPGGGLYVADLAEQPPRLTRLVDATKGLILDADLSYDARTILFSWKVTMQDKLQLFTVNVDGSGLQQVIHHDSNNLNACWLPDGGIAFLSDRKPAFAYCWTSTTPILYRCDRDGSNVVRISANYLNDFTPAVMDDGRVIFSRWEYVDRPAIPIQSLWTVNPDGTGLSGYFGNRVLSPATFMEAQEIAGSGKVLCVLTSHNGPCRGAIGIVDPAKGANAQDSIRNLTPEIDIGQVDRGNGNDIRGPYESPFPIDDRFFLVSRAGTILLRDYAGTGQATILAGRDGMGFYTAHPVMARKRPMLRWLSEQRPDEPWASVFVEDVYRGLEPRVKRGSVKQIAVVQELEKSKFADVSRRAFGFQFPVVSCGATYAPEKVWGFATVDPDGSAHFKVPPLVPIYFMALDAEGRAVQRMRSFTHLMPGESHSCVGCHTDRNHLAPSVLVNSLAAARPAEALEEPEWGVRGFSYPHIVQPVFDRHCTECHHAKLASGTVDLTHDFTDFFNVSYEVLARRGEPGQNPYTKWIPTFNGQEANILQVTPEHWGSPASRLATLVLSGHPDSEGRRRVDLTSVEQRRVFAWIDLNVPYYGTSESNHYDLIGCRQLLPANLEPVLNDVAAQTMRRLSLRRSRHTARAVCAHHERRTQQLPAGTTRVICRRHAAMHDGRLPVERGPGLPGNPENV